MSNPKEYQETVLTIILAARILSEHDLPAILTAIERAEAVGPLVDPTLYLCKAGAMDQDKQALQAALPLWRFGREVLPPAPADEEIAP